MVSFNKRIIQLFLFFCFSLCLISCSETPSKEVKVQAKGKQATQKSGAGKPGRAKKATPVETISPTLGTAKSIVTTNGSLEPNSDAKINARANGVVKNIYFEEGADVKAGTVLMKLEDDDQRLRVKQAQQTLVSAEQEYRRLNKMRKAGVVPPNEWEAADNNLKAAETSLELAQLALSYTKIVAPIDGRVVTRERDLGDYVNQGELLYRLMSIDPLLLRVHLPVNRIGKLTKGEQVDITIEHIEQPIVGKVLLISPIVDPSSGTIKITIEINDYPANVRPGDFAQVDVVTDKREQALLLPSSAILEERGNHYVFVDQQGKAEKRSVNLGFTMGLYKEIISGVSHDEKIVSKGQRNISDGAKINIVNTDKLTNRSGAGQP